MRYLLGVLLVLSVSAQAQSGTITMSTTPTDSAYTITLPPPDPGRTHVQVEASGTFDQGLTVWNPITAEVPAFARFGNTVSMRTTGGVVLARATRRVRVDILCGPDGATTGTVQSTVSIGFTASLNTMPDRTFILSNNVRQLVGIQFPFGGQFMHQTTSFCANRVDWHYLP